MTKWCSKWKFQVPVYFLKRNKERSSENLKYLNGYIIFISVRMKFRNKKKIRYGIPAYTGQFRALHSHDIVKGKLLRKPLSFQLYRFQLLQELKSAVEMYYKTVLRLESRTLYVQISVKSNFLPLETVVVL
jgi:hypothetical protein